MSETIVPSRAGTIDPFDPAAARGQFHSATIRDDGTVTCIGLNSDGQCDTPSDARTCSQVAVGSDHTVALTESGSVICWGSNSHGQSPASQLVMDATAVAAGRGFTATIRGDECVNIWGDFQSDDPHCRRLPGGCVWIPGKASITHLCAGNEHILALSADGALHYLPTRKHCASHPGASQPPDGDERFLAIASARDECAAIGMDGRIHEWGRYGRFIATPPSDSGRAADISLGKSHTAVRTDQGTVVIYGSYCDSLPWNLSMHARFTLLRSHGRRLTDRLTTYLLRQLEGEEIRQYIAQRETTLVLLNDGTIEEWSRDRDRKRNVPSNIPKARKICSSEAQSMALLADGKLCCWRHSKYPSEDKFETSKAPRSDRPFVDIAVGREHCIALQDDGVVVAWGDNRAGQCDVTVPPMCAKAVAASDNWTAVLLDSGKVTVSGWDCQFLPWDLGEVSTRDLLLTQSNRLTAGCIEQLIARNPSVCEKRGSGAGMACYLLDNKHLVVARNWKFESPTIKRFPDLRVIPFVRDFGIGADFVAVLFESGEVVSLRAGGKADVQIAPSALIHEKIEEIHVRKRGVWARTNGSALHIWGRVRNLRRCPWTASPQAWAEFLRIYGEFVALSTLPPEIANHELIAPLLK